MWTNVTTRLKAILESTAGVGTVLLYRPIIKTVTDLKTIFPLDSNNQINAWVIERPNFSINRKTSLSTQEWVHQFTVEGWITTTGGNSSYTTFQPLLDTILESFSENITLNITTSSTMALSPSVDIVDQEYVGEYLCNHAKITIPVREIRTVNYT